VIDPGHAFRSYFGLRRYAISLRTTAAAMELCRVSILPLDLIHPTATQLLTAGCVSH